MKKNTRLLLLALYHTELRGEDTGFRSYQYFYETFPYLSKGGIRSLIPQLVSMQLVVKKTQGIHSLFKITETGRLWIEEHYQCLRTVSTLNRDGYLILMNPSAFTTKNSLINLKNALRRYPHQVMSSQVWWLPKLPSEVSSLILKSYIPSVRCVEVKKWVIGQIFHPNNDGSSNNNSIYFKSGVSEGVARLLDSYSAKKRLTDKNKEDLRIFFAENVSFLENNKASSIFTKDEKQLLLKVVNDIFYLCFVR